MPELSSMDNRPAASLQAISMLPQGAGMIYEAPHHKCCLHESGLLVLAYVACCGMNFAHRHLN